jgi:hypothetical protein
LFAEYGIPGNLAQTLWLDGLANQIALADSDQPQPQIVFFSTGEVTPFGWTLQDPMESDQWRLTANPLGEFDLQLEPLR